MALSPDTNWEVRQGGNANNGGGFVVGASGTDYTLQDAAQYSLTGLTTAAADAIILSASAAAVMVGNTINITSGTNFTVGRYRIMSVVVGVSITVDRNCTTAAGSAGAGEIGGALANVADVSNGTAIGGNKIWVRYNATPYSRTATTTCSGGGYEYSGTRSIKIIGYNTTRGDAPTGANRPTISLATNTGLTGIAVTGDGIRVENLIVDCNSLGTSTGFSNSAGYPGGFAFWNCTAREFTLYGFNSSIGKMGLCEATAGTGAATAGFYSTLGHWYRCYSHDNSCHGWKTTSGYSGNLFLECVAARNTGASIDGANLDYYGIFYNCVFHANGRDGVFNSQGFGIEGPIVINCIFTSYVRYGYNFGGSTDYPARSSVTRNAYWANGGTGAINNLASTSGSDGTGAFSPTNVTLTGDPFVDATNHDYRLNNTAGAGAACRALGLGVEFLMPGLAAAALEYQDLGAFQHLESSGPVGRVVMTGRGAPY